MTTTTDPKPAKPAKLPTLKRARADYQAATDKANDKRAVFIATIRRERETRTLDDIGAELGVTRQTVMSLLARDDALKARDAKANK